MTGGVPVTSASRPASEPVAGQSTGCGVSASLLLPTLAAVLQGGLGQLPGGFVSLDASRPWICYWVLHGLALLGSPLPKDITASEVSAGVWMRAVEAGAGMGMGEGGGQALFNVRETI